MSVSQLPAIKPLLKAVIPFYPVLDFVTPSSVKCKSRRYKPELGGFRAKDTDFLMSMAGMFNWSYVSPGTKMADPLLSPLYGCSEGGEEGEGGVWVDVKGRDNFPPNIFVVACELDMLGGEAWRMACKLAGQRVPGVEEVIGQEKPRVKDGEDDSLLEFEDEKFHWQVVVYGGGGSPDGKKMWRYKWLLVPDVVHGFDQDNIGTMIRDEEAVGDGLEKREEVMKEVLRWLMEGGVLSGR